MSATPAAPARGRARTLVRGAILLLACGWCALVLLHGPLLPAGARPLAALSAVVAGAFLAVRANRGGLAIALGGAAATTAALIAVRPSHEREWRSFESRCPRAQEIDGKWRISDVRDFAFDVDGTVRPRWDEWTVDPARLLGVDLLVSTWPSSRAVAHTMLAFDFGDERVLCLSVEARREVGEEWGILPGIFKRFELIYVLGSERDLVGQRVGQRGERVYVYRTVLSASTARRLLASVLTRVDELAAAPEFYDTLRRNCTTSLVRHFNDVWPDRPPYRRMIVRNGFAPELALEAGLLESDLPFAEYRAACEVTERAREALGRSDFSRALRR